MNTDMKENETIENNESVDLLEDVDLKNLKVEAIPANVVPAVRIIEMQKQMEKEQTLEMEKQRERDIGDNLCIGL